MGKKIKFYNESREALKVGIDTLANAVKVTLGPRGRNVVLDRGYGLPLITNDGVTIAREIELEDEIENMGAQLLKEVAIKSNEVAGDGTTTATVLSHKMITAGLLKLEEGENPVLIRKGMEYASNLVVKMLEKRAKKIEKDEEIEQIATISSGNEKIGQLISEAMKKVGRKGVITVEEAKSLETELEIVEGLQFDNGYLSPYMTTNNERMYAELDNPFILITDRKISTMKELVPILEQVMNENRAILIIAENIESEALATLVVNKLRATLNVVAVKAPSFGDRRKAILEDIAILTGGEFISEEKGYSLENVQLYQLGQSRKVKVTKDTTTIIDGYGSVEDIENRIEQISHQVENAISDYDKEKLNERIAKLSGGVAIIKVGAATEIEMKEKKLRIEDALNATKAATEEGIVAGGGTILLEIAKDIEYVNVNKDEKVGFDIVKEALLEPTLQIAENSGVNGIEVIQNIYEKGDGIGYDAYNERYVNMIENGIIDPAKVTRSAIQNAISIASLILTTEVAIAKTKEEIKEENQGMY